MQSNMWLVYAILSAVFASGVAITAKLGLQGVNANLATAIRTVVILVMAWGIVFFTSAHNGLTDISQKAWWLLIASGVLTGLSWLFYFKALQTGDVSKVVPIDKMSIVITMVLAFVILGETPSPKTIIGGAVVAVGVLILAL